MPDYLKSPVSVLHWSDWTSKILPQIPVSLKLIKKSTQLLTCGRLLWGFWPLFWLLRREVSFGVLFFPLVPTWWWHTFRLCSSVMLLWLPDWFTLFKSFHFLLRKFVQKANKRIFRCLTLQVHTCSNAGSLTKSITWRTSWNPALPWVLSFLFVWSLPDSTYSCGHIKRLSRSRHTSLGCSSADLLSQIHSECLSFWLASYIFDIHLGVCFVGNFIEPSAQNMRYLYTNSGLGQNPQST